MDREDEIVCPNSRDGSLRVADSILSADERGSVKGEGEDEVGDEA